MSAIVSYVEKYVADDRESAREELEGLIGRMVVEFAKTFSVPSGGAGGILAMKNEKPKKPETAKCQGVTAKNKPCSRKVHHPDSKYCKIHDKVDEKPVVEKKKKPKKVKEDKVPPVHNHEIGESSDGNCDLCELHGDIADPDINNTEFVPVDDSDKRLHDILARCGLTDDEDDDEHEDEHEDDEVVDEDDEDEYLEKQYDYWIYSNNIQWILFEYIFEKKKTFQYWLNIHIYIQYWNIFKKKVIWKYLSEIN